MRQKFEWHWCRLKWRPPTRSFAHSRTKQPGTLSKSKTLKKTYTLDFQGIIPLINGLNKFLHV